MNQSPIYLPVPKVCCLKDCSEPSNWAPLFSLRPPASAGYSQAMLATPAVGICQGHRAWFLEVGFREWLPALSAQASSMGLLVDPALTTCELVKIGQPPPNQSPRPLAEHLL